MNANPYTIRQDRPNPVFAAGAAMLASALVLSSVLCLFAGNAAAGATHATVVVQHHAAERA
jgi:hypothetical protein